MQPLLSLPTNTRTQHWHSVGGVVCAYCREICKAKALLKLHLKATQHDCYSVVSKDESKAENVDKLEDPPIIPDGPCLIPCMKVF